MTFQARMTREDLIDGVKWAMRAVPRRPPMQVLLGVRMLATGTGDVRVAGFSYSEYAQADVAASGAEGDVLVPGRLLLDLLGTFPPKAEIDFDVATTGDKRRLRLSSGDVLAHLPMLALADYPVVPPMAEPAFALSGADLFDMGRVTLCAGRDDTLPILTAVIIEAVDGTLTAAATDRYRLGVMTTNVPVQSLQGPLHVPRDTVRAAADAFVKAAEVQVTTSSEKNDRWAAFRADGRVIASRTIEGGFPKYRSLLPTEYKGTMMVDRLAVDEAAKRAAVVGSRNMPVRLRITKDALVMRGGSVDDADVETRVPALTDDAMAGDLFEPDPTGPRGTVAFLMALNPSYLRDACKALTGATLTVGFTGRTRPAVFTGDGRMKYLLMPVRLAE